MILDRKKFFTLAVAVFLLGATVLPAAAHELYFSTPDAGQKGKTVEVQLYWGHFPNMPDPESTYFEQVAEGQALLLTPEGEQQELALQAHEEYYKTSFVPRTGGDFQVIFSHDRGVLDWQWSDPQGWQRVYNFAKIYVPVEGEPDIHAYDQAAGLDLEVVALSDVGHLHAGEEFRGELQYLGEPLAGAAVYVVGPAGEEEHGSTLELQSNPEGQFSFIPDTEGLWMIKAEYFSAELTEEIDGQVHGGSRYSLTTCIPVHAYGDEGHGHDTDAPLAGESEGGSAANAMIWGGAVLLALGALLFMVLGRRGN